MKAMQTFVGIIQHEERTIVVLTLQITDNNKLDWSVVGLKMFEVF